MSRDGMSTRIWGGPAWHLLRCIGFNYPPHPTVVEKLQYHRFVHSLGNVLPCGACRRNYPENLKAANFGINSLESRATFSRFLYDLELNVHQMTTPGTTPLPQSFEEQRATYECFRARCGHTAGPEDGCTQQKDYMPGRAVLAILPVQTDAPGFFVSTKCKERQ